jgi:acylpyruvate hydrolase
MRLVSFGVQAETRIGLIHGSRVTGLCNAFECVLVEEDHLPAHRAREVARGAIPEAMIDLVRRGEEGVACVRRVAAFLKRMDKGTLDEARSPSGDQIAYGIEQVILHKPLEAYRALNIGANYDAYLAMMKIVEPYPGTAEAFWKLPQCLIGPEEGILWPVSSKQITCEMELGVIVGKQGKRIPKEEALDYVYGYTVVNDVTAIDLLKRGPAQAGAGRGPGGAAGVLLPVDRQVDGHL